jgi:Tol biopolymer transport system component
VRAASDGSFLIFNGEKDNHIHLYRIDPDGANLRQLTFGETYDGDSTVSPDGNWIVYISRYVSTDGVKTALRKIPSAGGEPVLPADISCGSPNFSPDGKFISCVYEAAKFAILSAESGALVKIFEPVQIPYFNSGAHFSPDGRNLVYIARRKNFSNLWRQPADGGEPQPLTDFTSGDLHNFAFSADGARLYAARGFEVRDVVLIKNFK